MDNKLLKQSNIKGTFQLDFYPVTQWSAIVDAPSFEDNDGKVLNVTNNQLSWTGIKTINGESLFGDGNITVNTANADWNESNSDDPSYVLNRTHYVEESVLHYSVEETSPEAEESSNSWLYLLQNLTEDTESWDLPDTDSYLLACKNLSYNDYVFNFGELKHISVEAENLPYYGNLFLAKDIFTQFGIEPEDTGEDYCLFIIPFAGVVFAIKKSLYQENASIVTNVERNEEIVHKLDSKYLDITANDVTGLAAVALTGYYYSLEGCPTSLSSFTNDSGYITGSEVPSNQVQSDWNETSGASPAYIRNKPSITGAGTLNTTATTSQYPNLSEPLSGNVTLHQISKTGKYDDLLEKRLYYFYWDGQDNCVKDLSDGSVVSVKKLVELHFGWSHIIIDYNNFAMQLIDANAGDYTIKFKIDYYDQDLNTSSADFCIGVSDGTYEGTNDTWTFETFAYASLSDAHGAKYNTTAYWNNQIGFIPQAGEIIIYSDYHSEVVGNTTVYYPGIKIGSGNAYVQDLVFLNEDETNRLTQHLQDNVRHITAAERTLWNNKLNVETTITNETLVFTRN